MQTLRNAFIVGLQRSLQWPLLLPLYLTGLIFGLVQTWPVWVFGDFGTNPQLASIATQELDALLNLLLGNQAVQITAGYSVLLWIGLSLLLLLLYSLAYHFFSGGILSVWSGMSGFWAGCRRFFWTYIGLGLLLALFFTMITVISTVLISLLGQIGMGIGLLLITLLSLWGEYARALAPIRNQYNPFKLLVAAFSFGIHQPVGVVVLGLLGFGLHFIVLRFYTTLSAALSGTLSLVLLQQFVVLLWLWIKLLRLAWALSYIQAAEK